MDKREILKEEAKEQFFEACELLYSRGAKTLRDFSLRKIRDAKTELTGRGGKFNLADKYRKEWLKSKGLSAILPDGGSREEDDQEPHTPASNPLLYAAFEEFITKQAEVVAGQLKDDLEAKIKALEDENEALKQGYDELNKRVAINSIDNQAATSSGVNVAELFESIAELKLALKMSQEAQEKLKEEADKAILKKEVAENLAKSLHTDTALLDKERLKYYQESTRLGNALHKVKVDKAMLENQYRDALYDLDIKKKELNSEREKSKGLEKRLDEMYDKMQSLKG